MRICKNKKQAKIEAIIATWMKQEKLPDCLSEYQWNNARSEWERRKSSSAILYPYPVKNKENWKELMANYDSELCKFMKINLNADHQPYSWVYPEIQSTQFVRDGRTEQKKELQHIFMIYTNSNK